MTDVDLKRELAAMLGDEPGGGFDSNRALRSGRRHQLRRRMGSAAAVAAIAVFAIAVPVIIDQARDDGAAVTPGTSSSASDSVASTPTATPSATVDTPTPGITSSPAELKALLTADRVDLDAVDALIGDVIAQATGGTVAQSAGSAGDDGAWNADASYIVTRDGVSWTVETGLFEDLGTDYCLQIPVGGSCDSVDTADGGILVTQVDPDLRGSGVTEVTQQRFRPGVAAWVNGIGAVAGPDGSLFSDDLTTFTGTPTDYDPVADTETYASIVAFLIDGMPNANQLGSLG